MYLADGKIEIDVWSVVAQSRAGSKVLYRSVGSRGFVLGSDRTGLIVLKGLLSRPRCSCLLESP